MIYFIVYIICIISVEIYLRTNYIFLFRDVLRIAKKVFHTLSNSRISDHWKEAVIPAYAWKLIKLSVQIFFTILLIVSLIIVADIYIEGFISFTFSLSGICISMFFVMGHVWIRKFLKDE